MLREELSPTGGYAQILAAIGRGRTRFSHIAGEVGQRIDHALDVLIRTGFVGKDLPVGAPRGARATYEIPDPYLRFWFQVLYTGDGAHPRRPGGRGAGTSAAAVADAPWLRVRGAGARPRPAARAAGRASRRLGRRTVVVRARRERGGRRARLRGSRTALLGEARWQSARRWAGETWRHCAGRCPSSQPGGRTDPGPLGPRRRRPGGPPRRSPRLQHR